jgi:hypothetical protein
MVTISTARTNAIFIEIIPLPIREHYPAMQFLDQVRVRFLYSTV